ncbi:hypothetical protein BJX70DRAFT_400951 [Aspergillus crustosus]
MTSLLSLPLELLDRICEYVASSYRPGIPNLALVNRHCYTITIRHRFRCISINAVSDRVGKAQQRQTLIADVKRCTEILQSASAFTAVRQLSIAEYETCGLEDLDDLTIITAGARSLEHFKLRYSDITIPNNELSSIANVVVRQWDCTGGSGSKFGAVEPADIVIDAQEVGSMSRFSAGQVQLKRYEKPFRELWPRKSGRWEDDWHSFSLGKDIDEIIVRA